ncbi:MAG: T9SS type A sorting domain-containing protein [Bacteroidales bacterium]|nr:T9SS type A sorting domain-containing protein [Bacteroidales bacterium]
MKKITLLLVLALSTLFALAQNGRIDLRHETKAEITHSEFTNLRATFSYGSIESIEIATERGTFSEIAIEGTYASGEIGTPELPASHQLLAVPFGATPRVNVISYTTTDYRLSDYGIGTILPHQPSVRKDQNPEDVEFVYNTAAYQTRSLATAPEATIEVQGTMRGIRIGSMLINPVSYNPAANTLRVFNDIEVEVSFDGADRAETERMLLSTYSPYFDIVYKQMFNYRQILDVYTDHPDLMAYPVHMIVITPQDYITALQPWINWKIQKGFDVNVVTTAQAGGNYNAIQSYVQNLYNTGVNQGATPTFVILVGDTGQIPGKTSGNATNKVTDLYYGSIDGDYFPDMFYSRMSAESPDQVTAIVNKILQYEQYTMPDPSYLNNVTLIAGWDSYWTNYVGKPTIQYAMQYYYNTAHGFTNVYNWLGQPYTNCYASLSSGTGFVNYTAHGSETSWSDPQLTKSQVNALTNTNKYFLAMGNCCLTGNFGYSQPCFGEAMLRGENKAAYSYIGSCPVTYWYEDYYFGVGATSTFGQMPNINNTATGVYDGIWMDDTYNTVSSIVFLGNLAVCYAHAGNYQTSSSPTYYWQAYHVLGDGSIMPYRVNPTPNTVSHASTFPSGATTFQVNAQAGSYVGISQNNVLKGAALVPASGSVNVQVASGITSGQVRIVVTKPQCQPYIQDINVGSAPQSYTISVSANPTIGGSVTGGGTYNQGANCTVTASPNNGYTFTNWTENGSVVSTSASYTFTVTGNRTLVANFQAQPQSYTISVSANPTNGGSVTGGGTYQQGQSCTVTATPASGYTFLRWTENGNQVSTNASYTFTVTGNRTLVAQFQAQPQSYTINVSANPTNGGSVSGGGTYQQGQSCTVTATPATGYTFLRWTENGNQVSTNASYTFTVTGNRTLVAQFQAQSYTITVTADPTNGGTVTGGGSYQYGQSCTVSATPATGFDFVRWTRNGTQVSTNPNYTFTVTGSATYVAEFQAQLYYIAINCNPSNGGTASGNGYYTYGQSCTVTATPATGYEFVNWTEDGNEVSTNASYTFTVTNGHNLTANFSLQTIEITTSVDPAEGGTASGAGTYNYGDEVTITVETNEDWAFVNWTENGTVVAEEKTFTFTATANRDFVAHLIYTVGVGEQTGKDITLYPNPVNDKLTIEAEAALGTIEIYNLMGALVFSQKGCANKVEINTSELQSGIYFIRMTNDNASETRRFVKE